MAHSIVHFHVFLAVDAQGFIEEYGHSDACSLSDVLWTCSSMLSNRYCYSHVCILYQLASLHVHVHEMPAHLYCTVVNILNYNFNLNLLIAGSHLI